MAILGLPGEDLADILATGQRADVPLLDVPDALGVLHRGAGDQGDVAEGRAGKAGGDGQIGVFVQLVGQPLVMAKVFLRGQGSNSSRLSAGSSLASSMGLWRTIESKK